MDFERFLVLYSGGADSTHFIEHEPTARHLIFYRGHNDAQAKVALTNARILGRYINVIDLSHFDMPDGEVNEIQVLYDTKIALDASIRAVSYGLKGIVMCFNADDIGIEADAIETIMRRAEPNFELLQPLKKLSAKEIRDKRSASKLQTVSCMQGERCGHCPKCTRGY